MEYYSIKTIHNLLIVIFFMMIIKIYQIIIIIQKNINDVKLALNSYDWQPDVELTKIKENLFDKIVEREKEMTK